MLARMLCLKQQQNRNLKYWNLFINILHGLRTFTLNYMASFVKSKQITYAQLI